MNRTTPGLYGCARNEIPRLLPELHPTAAVGYHRSHESAHWRVKTVAKVLRADVGPPGSKGGRQAAFNRISAKHVALVLCDPASLRGVGVVELDDKSHRTLERGFRDDLMDAALAGAGMPTIRFAACQAYSPIELRDEVRRAVLSK